MKVLCPYCKKFVVISDTDTHCPICGEAIHCSIYGCEETEGLDYTDEDGNPICYEHYQKLMHE